MGKRLQEGFTLIELVVVLMVASIAFGIGIPATNDFVANGRMAAAVNDFVSSVYFARSQALALGSPVAICASADGTVCNDGARLLDGWIVYRDTDKNGRRNDTPTNPEPVFSRHGTVPEQIASNAKSRSGAAQPEYLYFASDGSAPVNAPIGPTVRDIQLCDDRGARNMGSGIAAGRWITIRPNGRADLMDHVLDVQGVGNPYGGC